MVVSRKFCVKGKAPSGRSRKGLAGRRPGLHHVLLAAIVQYVRACFFPGGDVTFTAAGAVESRADITFRVEMGGLSPGIFSGKMTSCISLRIQHFHPDLWKTCRRRKEKPAANLFCPRFRFVIPAHRPVGYFLVFFSKIRVCPWFREISLDWMRGCLSCVRTISRSTVPWL